MKRLTKTCSDGSHRAADNLPCGENSWHYKALLLERLGAYEDTGLEPNEIEALKTRKDSEICGVTKLPCIHCNPGPCESRSEI